MYASWFLPYSIIPRRRLWLTSLALLISAMILGSSASFFLGVQQATTSYYASSDNIFVINDPLATTPFTSRIPSAFIPAVSQIKGVLVVSPETLTPVMYHSSSIFVRGVIFHNFTKLEPITLLQGSFPDPTTLYSGVIGSGLANRFNLKTGDIITLTSTINSIIVDITITGIFTSHSIIRDEILVPLTLGQKLGNQGSYHVTHIRVKYDPTMISKEKILETLEKPIPTSFSFTPRNGTLNTTQFSFIIIDKGTNVNVVTYNHAQFGVTYQENMYLSVFQLKVDIPSINYIEYFDFTIDKINPYTFDIKTGPNKYNVTFYFYVKNESANNVSYRIYQDDIVVKSKGYVAGNDTISLREGTYSMYASYFTNEQYLEFTIHKPFTMKINFTGSISTASILSPYDNANYSTTEIPLLIQTNALNLEYSFDNKPFQPYSGISTLNALNGPHNLTIRYISEGRYMYQTAKFSVNTSLPDIIDPLLPQKTINAGGDFTLAITKPLKTLSININNETLRYEHKQLLKISVPTVPGLYPITLIMTFWNNTQITKNFSLFVTNAPFRIKGATQNLYGSPFQTYYLQSWNQTLSVILNENTTLPINYRDGSFTIPNLANGNYTLSLRFHNHTINSYSLYILNSSALFFNTVNTLNIRNETIFSSNTGWFTITPKSYDQPTTLYIHVNNSNIPIPNKYSFYLPAGNYSLNFTIKYPTNTSITREFTFISNGTVINHSIFPTYNLELSAFPRLREFNAPITQIVSVFKDGILLATNISIILNEVLAPGNYTVITVTEGDTIPLLDFTIPVITTLQDFHSNKNMTKGLYVLTQDTWLWFTNQDINDGFHIQNDTLLFSSDSRDYTMIDLLPIVFTGVIPRSSINGVFNISITNDFYHGSVYLNGTLFLELSSRDSSFSLQFSDNSLVNLTLVLFDELNRETQVNRLLYPFHDNVTLQIIVTDSGTNLPLENAQVLIYSLDYNKLLLNDLTTSDPLVYNLSIGMYNVIVSWQSYSSQQTILLLSNQTLEFKLGRSILQVLVYYPNEMHFDYLGLITVSNALTSEIVFYGSNSPDLRISLYNGLYTVTVSYKGATTQQALILSESMILYMYLPLIKSNVTIVLTTPSSETITGYEVTLIHKTLKQQYFPTRIQNNEFYFENVPQGNVILQISSSKYFREIDLKLHYKIEQYVYALPAGNNVAPSFDISKLPQGYQLHVINASDYANQYLTGPLQIAQTALFVEIMLIIVILIANNVGIMRGFIQESMNDILIVLQIGGSKFQAYMSTLRSLIGLSLVFGGLGYYFGYGLILLVITQGKVTLLGHTFYPVFTWFMLFLNSVLLFILTIISFTVSFLIETRNADPWMNLTS